MGRPFGPGSSRSIEKEKTKVPCDLGDWCVKSFGGHFISLSVFRLFLVQRIRIKSL